MTTGNDHKPQEDRKRTYFQEDDITIQSCEINALQGFQAGSEGKCHTYLLNNELSRANARAKAEEDAKEMKMNEILSGEFEEITGIEILNNFPNSHGVVFTNQDFDQMVDNFRKFKESTQPNVKMSHADQQFLLKELFKTEKIEHGEELPSLGLIRDMRIEDFGEKGRRLLADIERVPKALKDKVFGGKMFKAISPEILLNFRNTGQKFIKAIALTNNPSLRHIENVHMSEALGYGGDFTILRGDSMSDKDDKNKIVTPDELDEKLKSFGEGIMDKITGFLKKKPEDIQDKGKDKIDDNQVVSMSEFNETKEQLAKAVIKMNELSTMLLDKEGKEKDFDKRLIEMQEYTRTKTSESICSKAKLEGVPTGVVDYFKPLLMSELVDTTVKLSEVIDGKTIEAEKKMSEFVEGFFNLYPSKIKMSDLTRTSLNEPGDDEDGDKEMVEILKLSEELQKKGMSEEMALMEAGRKVRGGND